MGSALRSPPKALECCFKNQFIVPSMVAYGYNPSSWEVET